MEMCIDRKARRVTDCNLTKYFKKVNTFPNGRVERYIFQTGEEIYELIKISG